MSDGDTPERVGTHDPGREYGTVALVAVCAAAIVLAIGLLPGLSALGLSGAPAESLVPLPPNAAGTDANGAGGQNASQFGALRPGASQSVGGSVEGGDSFRSLNSEVHFTVQSEEPGYWRTGAYDTYAGGSWERSAPSDTTAPTTGESIRYEVELNQSASAPPAVWQPVSVDGPSGLSLAEGGIIDVDSPLPAGTTYSGVSRAPPDDPSVLQASGRSYPDDIEGRYTALPTETAADLGPFTENLTANASTPYETAVTVEQWLEGNKDYSLEVTPPEGDVAEQFVFEMDEGYCEYFATSMTAMLRSQGVPARYVVGYSTGERVGNDTYRVRALNAHAWVEVYFDEVGWVRFDPTPGADRVDRQRDSLEADGVTSYDPPTDSSPGDPAVPESMPNESTPAGPTPDGPTTGPDESTTPATPTGPTRPSSPGPSDESTAYDISLNRTAVPGATVEVSVTAGSAPVVDAAVRFNGQPVGRTDDNGTVVAAVPYADELTVTASGGTVVRGADESALAGVGVGPPADGETGLDGPPENASETYALETDAALVLSGDRRTGSTVTVTASLDDVPVEGASVLVDGGLVATTDADGRAEITLPETPGTTALRIERGPVSAARTVSLDALNATIEPRAPLPIPGTSVDVVASVGGEPTAGVPVTVGGERVGTTDVNGTLSATLPAGLSVPVAASYGAQSVERTVASPLVNLLGVVGVALALVVGSTTAMRRRGLGLRDLPRAVPAALYEGGRALVRLFVGFAVAVGYGLDLAAGRAELTASHLRALATGAESPRDLANALQAWAGGLPGRAAGAVATALPARLSGAGRRGTGASGSVGEGPHVTIREGWRRFVAHVSVGDPETRTPGQLAAHAIAEDDLPADAVQTLRDEFRAVEYGPRAPDDAVPSVAAAVESIEDTVAARSDEARATGETSPANTDGETEPDDSQTARPAGEGGASGGAP